MRTVRLGRALRLRRGIPKTIIGYISGEFAKAFALTLTVVTGVWVLGSAIVFIRGQILGPAEFLAMLPLLATTSLKYTLPLSVLFGSSFAYGRMSTDNEIRAMEWNGVHLGWILLPAASIAVAASCISVVVNAELIPASHRRLQSLVGGTNVMEAIDRQLSRGAQGRDQIHIDRFAVDIKGYDRTTRRMERVDIYETREGKTAKERSVIRRIEAKSATIRKGKLPEAIPFGGGEKPESARKYVTFVFDSGYVNEFDPDTGVLERRFPVPAVAFDFSTVGSGEPRPKMLSSGDLFKYSLNAAHKADRLDARTDYFERIALGVSPFFFVLLAAPLALAARWKHLLTSFLPSFGVVTVVFYPLVMLAKVWGNEGHLDPFYGLFMGDAALLVVTAVVVTVLLRR